MFCSCVIVTDKATQTKTAVAVDQQNQTGVNSKNIKEWQQNEDQTIFFFFLLKIFFCGPPVNMDGTITYRPSQNICAL